ncbi:MAG: hypothetical protein KAX38_02105, partial [Candidatus Krumholzibacteria bacterium]|nr:hypothetical protein [Candidatus Krumholzibacteria bacterium]
MGNVITIVGIALVLSLSPSARATAGWQLDWIAGEVGPKSWSIAPLHPTIKDVILFSGPTGVHSNSCYAEMFAGGSPTLVIDSANHQIELWFQPPPPEGCWAVYDPVCGLEGEFGPLEEGDWLFFSHSPATDFSIPFHVSP